MGMAAILVMWPGTVEQTFVPPSHRSSILIGPVVSVEMFKVLTTTMTDAYLSQKLTKLSLLQPHRTVFPLRTIRLYSLRGNKNVHVLGATWK